MFTSRITVPTPPVLESEDIFSSALSSLFTDDAQNSHGTPGSSIAYQSPIFGEITLRIPAHPDVEEGRKLFAHYLWNSAVVVAAAIETASCRSRGSGSSASAEWDGQFWDMRGRQVLELGAGTALPSLISALSGARSITVTDHPSSPALVNGAIEQNVQTNLFHPPPPPPPTQQDTTTSTSTHPAQQPGIINNPTPDVGSPRTKCSISIYGYTWGTELMYLPSTYGKPAPKSEQPTPTSFDRIIVADCLWLPSQHANIVKTILRYLKPIQTESDGKTTGMKHEVATAAAACAIVVAGFHTGRGIVAGFLEIATGSSRAWDDDQVDDGARGVPMEEGERSVSQHESDERRQRGNQEDDDDDDDDDDEIAQVKGTLKAASLYEIDVDGNRRPWQPVRLGEDKLQAKRWCLCAVLVRR